MDENKMIQVFQQYEKTFGEWLYSAWDFNSVDWNGLAEEAEKCIQQNKPMTDEVKGRFFEPLEEGKIY